MPSINDITEAIEHLRLDAIDVHEEACVAVRNRNSRCRKCAEACIADAISVSHNEVRVDAERCVNCGACVAACPNSALRAKDPSAASVTGSLMLQSSSGRVVIACARKAAKHEVDGEEFAEVPCLAHLDEEQLLEFIAGGAQDVILVDGCCETCKHGVANVSIDEVVEQASCLLDVTDAQAAITRMSGFPEDMQRLDGSTNRGEDRRGLFRQTSSYMRAVASNMVKKTIDDHLVPGGSKKRTLRDRLVEARTGALKKLSPKDNHRIIDAWESIGMSEARIQAESIDTRHFGQVSIDADKCSGCGMCVLFCPTAALQYNEFDAPSDERRRFVEFSASECTQCNLCRDVCIRRCLQVDSKVPLEAIFELEPANLEISKPINRTTIEAMAKKGQAL